MSSKALLIEVVGEDIYQDFEAGLGISIESPDGYVYRFTKSSEREAHVSRRFGTKVEKGTVYGRDIYDSVASYIVSVRLGTVDWECGNVRVSLPSSMPPQPPRYTGFVSFVVMQIGQLVLYSLQGPRVLAEVFTELHRGLVTDDDGIIQVYWFLSGVLLIVGTLLVGVLGLIYERIFVDVEVTMLWSRLWAKTCIPLCIAYYIYLSYRRWQRQWGGEMS